MTETGQAMHGGRLKGISREFPIFESLVINYNIYSAPYYARRS